MRCIIFGYNKDLRIGNSDVILLNNEPPKYPNLLDIKIIGE